MNKFLEMSTFIAVVDAGSLTEAAKRLGTAKSVVSERIHGLETRLRAPLIERGTRLKVTDAGQRFYDSAVRILDEVQIAEETLEAAHDGFSGPLRIATPIVFGQRYLASILTEFAATYPDIRLDVEGSDDYVNMMDENYDLAIRMGVVQDSTLVAKTITENRHVICASPAYLAQNGTPLHPRELNAHQGLMYSFRQPGMHWSLPVDGVLQRFAIRRRLRTNSGYQLEDALLAGLGIAIMPTFQVADALIDGRLISILSPYVPTGSVISAVYKASRRGSPKIHALAQLIGQRLGQPAIWDVDIQRALASQ
ncbi:LysR family transcriptional regulator [Dyella silvatica]|uniref:LysR family transcriptional regulator n=1 Tax=Dyella silvatica TaxID=2992128 RepID=UPI002259C1E2|nr:LysR family transcriptional regulator [Dyella silvatica]